MPGEQREIQQGRSMWILYEPVVAFRLQYYTNLPATLCNTVHREYLRNTNFHYSVHNFRYAAAYDLKN